MVIFVFGLPGSGKSYFASRLAEKLSAGYINSDRLRKAMFKERVYSDQEKRLVYEKMLAEMKANLKQNKNVVLDATFHREDTRKLFLDQIPGKTPTFFIEVQAAEEIIRERLKKERPFSEADFEVYKRINEKFERLNTPHLILQSTDENIHEMLQKGTEYLNLKNDERAN